MPSKNSLLEIRDLFIVYVRAPSCVDMSAFEYNVVPQANQEIPLRFPMGQINGSRVSFIYI